MATLPCGIDGLAVYIITNVPPGNDQQAALLSDGRKWKKGNITQRKRHVPMRYADCRRSFKCTNAKCPFRIEYGVVNRTQVNKNKEGIATCQICGEESEYFPCPARRYIRKGKKNIRVFLLGGHTCPVISKPEKLTKKIRGMLIENLKLTLSEVQSSFIMPYLRQEGDWESSREYRTSYARQKVERKRKKEREERDTPMS